MQTAELLIWPFMTTGSAASKLVIDVGAWSLLWSSASRDYTSRWTAENSSRHVVDIRARVAVRVFNRRHIKFAFLAADSFRYMEGDGDLMKMLMHADPPEENIQGTMEETGMVQSGVWWVQLLLILYDHSFSHADNTRMCVERKQYDLYFHGINQITDISLRAEWRCYFLE